MTPERLRELITDETSELTAEEVQEGYFFNWIRDKDFVCKFVDDSFEVCKLPKEPI